MLQLQREPLLANNASELEVHQMPAYADHPVDYFVPDFGLDSESLYTQNNIKMAEAASGAQMSADWGFDKSTVATPRDYFVPDFGVDEDVRGVTESIGNAETGLG